MCSSCFTNILPFLILFSAPDLKPYKATTVAHVSLPFNVTTYMGPKSRVLVYYIKNDGEIVSGSSEFNINNIFENQVCIF